MNVLDSVVSLLAPAICVGCGVEGRSLCAACALSSVLPFGERCYLCQSLSPRSRTCDRCRRDSPRYTWVTTSYGGITKELVEIYKFYHQRAAASSIADLMIDTQRRFMGESERARANYVVVPLPTATGRVRQRSFDHTRLIAGIISDRLKLDFAQPLRRLGQSDQVGARRQQRLSQQKDAYALVDPDAVAGRNILLIDDIVTTGASIREVTRTLKAGGARHVDALILARNL